MLRELDWVVLLQARIGRQRETARSKWRVTCAVVIPTTECRSRWAILGSHAPKLALCVCHGSVENRSTSQHCLPSHVQRHAAKRVPTGFWLDGPSRGIMEGE